MNVSHSVAAADRPGILYISYDGMLEPLGQSQVVAYLERLAPGRRIHLISFEKDHDWADSAWRDAMRDRLRRADIRWHPLKYHKSPSAPATAYDMAVGSAAAVCLARRHQLGLIHARSYVAAAMALAAKKMTGAAFLFDMRGLWADERVDGGLWPSDGTLYRSAKALERKFLLIADHVVTLTHASEKEIRSFDYLQERTPPISVIPTCADLDRFNLRGPTARDPFVLGYVGAVGTWYLLDEMLECFRLLLVAERTAHLLVVNRNEHDLIRTRVAAAGLDRSSVEIVASEHEEVPQQIRRMSAGMALIKPSYSKVASAPTKLAEYLGCGVPCLCNAGVGDMEGIVENRKIGVAVHGFATDDLALAMQRLRKLARQPRIQEKCHQAAQDLFSIEAGSAAYATIYDRLVGSPFR